ncbi:MAG TPA: protein translocase subunit SecF [Thermodesulfobacteriota bacterium]
MDFVRNTKIDFLGKRKITFAISIALIILGFIAAAAIPLGRANLSTDFEGGIAIQFRFQKAYEIDRTRTLLAERGFKDASLQQFADPAKLLVKLKRSDGDLRALSQTIGGVFTTGMPDNSFVIDSTTEIGPTVGKRLQKDALWAVIVSMIGILVYVAWRFEFRFGVAAVVATFHDVLAVLGVFYLLDKEVSLLIVTALLTVAGYSLTDTVVVFDRIRENMRKKTKEDFVALINRSVNEVLSRTIVTSSTTLLASLALVILGGEVIHDFALALSLGVIVGTYSSIFIASPLLLYWNNKKKPVFAKA